MAKILFVRKYHFMNDSEWTWNIIYEKNSRVCRYYYGEVEDLPKTVQKFLETATENKQFDKTFNRDEWIYLPRELDEYRTVHSGSLVKDAKVNVPVRESKINEFRTRLNDYNIKCMEFIELCNVWKTLTPQERGRCIDLG